MKTAAARIRGAQVDVLPDASHSVFYEQPADLDGRGAADSSVITRDIISESAGGVMAINEQAARNSRDADTATGPQKARRRRASVRDAAAAWACAIAFPNSV